MHPPESKLPNPGLGVASPIDRSAVSANSGVSPNAGGGSSDNDAIDEDDEEMVNDHVSNLLCLIIVHTFV